MRQPSMRVSASTLVSAPPETVFKVYADYDMWPRIFVLVKAVRLLRYEGSRMVLELDHAEGKVLNVVELSPPTELRLWEVKRRYDALFVNRFMPAPEGTRFTVTGHIRLKGFARMLRPILRGWVRRRMTKLQLWPVKAAAEAQTAARNTVTGSPGRVH